MPILRYDHQGACLELRVEEHQITLNINGLTRATSPWSVSAAATAAVPVRLSTTVQTDYEWHEFIEGIVSVTAGKLSASLAANNQPLVTEFFAPEVT